MRFSCRVPLLILFSLLLCSLSAEAQRLTISGRVIYEQDRRPAELITITLQNFTDMAMEKANSDSLGGFSFSVPRGVYYLSVRLTGYAEINERVEVGLFSQTGIILQLRPLPRKDDTISLPPTVPAEYLRIPQTARTEFEAGMKLYLREDKLAESLPHLRKAVEIHPQFASAYYWMGMVQIDQGEPDQALDSFERAIAEDKKYAPAYFPLGAIRNQRKEYAEAERVLRKGLEIKEDIWQLHFELARAVAYQGRWTEAEKIAERATALNNKAPKVHLLLANIYFELGKADPALAAAEEFLKLAPDDPAAPLVRRQVEAMRKQPAPPKSPPQ